MEFSRGIECRQTSKKTTYSLHMLNRKLLSQFLSLARLALSRALRQPLSISSLKSFVIVS